MREERSSYMTDEIIYNFAFELEKKVSWEPEDKDGEREYYSAYPLFRDDWWA